MYTVYNGQWSNSLALTSTTTSDTHPDLVADRNGTLWLFFARDIVLSSGTNGVSENDLYYSYSYNTGSSWTSPVQLTAGGTASNPVDSMDPSAVQGSDKMLWLFYSTDVTGGGSDRKSTRLNSSHQIISYAVFCLKKKKIKRKSMSDLILLPMLTEFLRVEPHLS